MYTVEHYNSEKILPILFSKTNQFFWFDSIQLGLLTIKDFFED